MLQSRDATPRRTSRATSDDVGDVWLAGFPVSCNGDVINGLWVESGRTADNRTVYTHTYRGRNFSMFYDIDCDGDEGSRGHPIWIMDSGSPNMTAHHDLDGDGKCIYIARTLEATTAFTPPSTGDWHVACNHSWTTLSLSIQPVTVSVTGACDPSAAGKDEASGLCVCAKDLFCVHGPAAGDVCDPSAPRDRWNPDKVSAWHEWR